MTSINENFAFFAVFRYFFHDVVVLVPIEVAKRKVFQFPLDAPHTQAVGQRSIDVQGFFGIFLLPFRRQVPERAHVVQPVRKLDQNYPQIFSHSQKHLSDVFCLLFFLRQSWKLLQLGDAVYEKGYLLAELRFNGFFSDGSVFNDVVEQPSDDGVYIELEIGKNIRHL